MPVSEIKIVAEPIFEVGERVASPVEGAGCPEPLLVFELKRTHGSAGSFDFDLAVDAFVDEPKVGKAGPVIEAPGLPAFVNEAGDRFEKIDDFVLNAFFGSHKKFLSSLLYFRLETHYNRIVLGNYLGQVFSSACIR